MHHNLLLAWLAAFLNEVEKKEANQANSKLWVAFEGMIFTALLNGVLDEEVYMEVALKMVKNILSVYWKDLYMD